MHKREKDWNRYLASKIAYFSILFIVSGYVLVIFFTPTSVNGQAMNGYYKAKFIDMIQGTAYKPFVYRTLLPTTIRIVSHLTPASIHASARQFVEQHLELTTMFRRFQWETSASYEYLVAAFLMVLCYMASAHYTAKLSMQICEIPDGICYQLVMAILALMVLPSFFKLGAYPYDPPQLFLFTLALYFCANHNLGGFFVTFLLCCFNKETAILLIPVFMLTNCQKHTNVQYWSAIIGSVACYIMIQGLIRCLFWSNPGSFVEIHLKRNVFKVLMRGWSFTDIIVCLVLAVLLFFRWKEKPAFLRVSFVSILSPLAILILVLGYIDEWRVYYEVYPIAFGLAIDSGLRIKAILDQNPTNLVSSDKSISENRHHEAHL